MKHALFHDVFSPELPALVRFEWPDESFGMQGAVIASMKDIVFLPWTPDRLTNPFASPTGGSFGELAEGIIFDKEWNAPPVRFRAHRPAPSVETLVRSLQDHPIRLYGFVLPNELRAIADRIDQSRGILALHDNWDGEGSPGYDEATWLRAAGLIVDMAVSFHHSGRTVPSPIITEGDDGSIDVQWRTSTRNVLINVPREPGESITFYAHDRENDDRDIEGKLDAFSDNGWLLGWLCS